MKPDDILNAIGDVDDIYIKKAHKKSLLCAILVFCVMTAVSCVFLASQLSDNYILTRFHTDFSVNTGFIEPEVLIHDSWTSLEQTTYADGAPVSTTHFTRTFYDNYAVIHTHNGEVTRLVGTSVDPAAATDYLESKHYANLYLRTSHSIDLIDRIDSVAIYSETAYGDSVQELNAVKLEYLQRGDLILRQTQVKNIHTPEETVLRSRGYDHHKGRISGWKEWDAEGTLLSYAEYTYDGDLQTVSTYLSGGTPTGTRISKYRFGALRWREYYDPSGELVSKEVYHYRVWELFDSLEGFASLFILLALAATISICIWDDRIQLGTRLVPKAHVSQSAETEALIREMGKLCNQLSVLSEALSQADPRSYTGELSELNQELKQLTDQLAAFFAPTPDDP